MGQGVLSHLPGYRAALMTVYHDCADPAEVLAPLAAAFPQATLAPVRLPHFYYPGMRIEVDLYATTASPQITQSTDGPAQLTLVQGGPLTLCHLSGPDMASCLPLLSRIDEPAFSAPSGSPPNRPPATFLTPPPA